MSTWAEFAAAAPEIADKGRELIYRTKTGQALLSTVRDDLPPRIHPMYVAILEGRLVAFLHASPKMTDLLEDGRYALHAHQDPAAPHEFLLRGRARPVDDPATRTRFVDGWYFEVDDAGHFFEFDVKYALFGERPGRHAWPPRYSSWRNPGG